MIRNSDSTEPPCFHVESEAIQQAGKQRGIAIITVLAVLLLMSVLVLAFMSMATNEYTAANNYDYSIRSRQAADAAISMVIGQIRKATTQSDLAGTNFRFTWASQPGAITSFKDRKGSGISGYMRFEDAAFLKYKLYSSDRMEVPGDYQLALDVPEDWDQHPELYVDLNDPLFRMRPSSDGSLSESDLIFPIVDPRAFDGTSRGEEVGENQNGPEGFGYTDTNSVGARIAGVEFGTDNEARLPMPVMWMYMLQDGTIGHLDEGGSFNKSFGEGEPSPANPITYRFAFWTDDESCKVNVNIASEGAFWDLPRTASATDRLFAERPPVENELTRFPGHPATTSLSPILYPREYDQGSRINAIRQDLAEVTPRVGWGGTQGGTRRSTSRVSLDDDRFYASIDETIYKQGGAQRQKNQALSDAAQQRRLERARFMLTTNSRAPELTLFGTPRLCLWPMHENEGGSVNQYRTAHDDLIAYCTTIPSVGANRRKYFFQRLQNHSRHQEFYNRQGGANVALLKQYLIPHTDLVNPIPGFGGSFASKYGGGPYGDRMQICVEIIDFIRGVNLYDPVLSNPYTDRNANRHGQVAGICECGGSGPHNSRWHNEALKFAKGFGRMATVSEVALGFVTTAEKTPEGQKGDANNLRDLGQNQKRVQAMVFLETFSPSHGYTQHIQETKLQVLDGSKRLTQDSNGDPAATMRVQGGTAVNGVLNNRELNAQHGYLGSRKWGGSLGVRSFMGNQGNTPLVWVDPSNRSVNGHIIVSANSQKIQLDETKLRIILYDSNGGGKGNLIQVFDVTFPAQDIPVPKYSNSSSDTWEERCKRSWGSATGYKQLFLGSGQESVRSMVVSHGDYRMVAAKRVVVNERTRGGINHFQEHPKTSADVDLAHSLVASDGVPLEGATFGSLVNGVNYTPQNQPDFPADPSFENYNDFIPRDKYSKWYDYMDPSIGGDFNNGLSRAPDGAYINRADDGDAKAGAYYENLDKPDQRNRAYFTPNRLISGPGLIGSLSTGVQSFVPWRAILLRPDPNHFGAVNENWNPITGQVRSNILDPPDHLWMDLLWMPIVQPFAISEPFSTMGKINMNYQIAPFDYIKRASGMHAAFRGEKVIAIPTSASNYKTGSGGEFHKDIDAYETLKQFEHRFADGEIFRSATEICEIYLVPKGEQIGSPSRNSTTGMRDYASMRTFWGDHGLTGDNTKERPYAGLYPRLTTKSNVYKVHMLVQNLKKARSTDADTFDPERDRVTSQWRGSAVIERSIDPNDRSIPNYIDSNGPRKKSLENFYNYRVLNVKQFAP